MKKLIKKLATAATATICAASVFGQITINEVGDMHIPGTNDLRFGTGSGAWGIEHWQNGLNFYKPWPSTNSANYYMFIRDADGRIGIGTGTPDYGKIQIGLDGASNGFTIHNGSGGTFRMWRSGDYGYITRGPNSTRGITLRPDGRVAINNSAGSSTYELYVQGDIYATGIINSSDESFKENISSIKTANKLFEVEGASYNFKQEFLAKRNLKSDSNEEEIIDDAKSLKSDYERKHYGFIAQDVQKIFPELVHTADDGTLGIDYIGFIPLLLEALRDQQNKIADMENELRMLGNKPTLSNPKSQNSSLKQNSPNPFNSETTIKMTIDESVENATIYVYDLNGIQLKSITVSGRGETSITISAYEFEQGMYIYSLVADGSLLGSKQMIITE